MRIDITEQTRLMDLQKEFTSIYPYLRIEFFIPDIFVQGQDEKKIVVKNQSFSDISSVEKININIFPLMTVSDLVQKFKESFNIIIHVFRKSGKAWLEITGTDGWTLLQQNLEGASLSVVKN